MNIYKFNYILRDNRLKKLSEDEKEFQLKNLYNRNEAIEHCFKKQKTLKQLKSINNYILKNILHVIGKHPKKYITTIQNLEKDERI